MSYFKRPFPKAEGGKFFKVGKPYPTGVECADCGRTLMAYDLEGKAIKKITFPLPCECKEMQRRQDDLDSANKAVEEAYKERFYRLDLVKVAHVAPMYELSSLDIHKRNERAAARANAFLAKAIEARGCVDIPGFGVYGPPSVGKTHLVAGIVKELQAAFIGAVITNPFNMQMAVQRTFEKDSRVTTSRIIQDFCEVPLLVLDDLGREQMLTSSGLGKEYFHSVLFDILDQRIGAGLPVIISTNYSPADLAKRYRASEYGGAIIERLGQLFGKDPEAWVYVTDTHSRRTGAPIEG